MPLYQLLLSIISMKQQNDSDYIGQQQIALSGHSDQLNEENDKFRTYKKEQASFLGKWTEEQHIKYLIFMDYYSSIFQSSDKRKLTKIFTKMAGFIQSRNSQQCRSHHQKMKQKYGSSKKIVSNQKKQYQNYGEVFVSFTQKFKDSDKSSTIEAQNPEMKYKKECNTIATQTDSVTIMNKQEQAYYLWQTFQNSQMQSEASSYKPIPDFYNRYQ